MTHPYYVGKARRALADAGADPARATELAGWAEGQMAQPASDRAQGAVVAADGRVLAGTFLGRLATYVDATGVQRYNLTGNEVALACGKIGRAEGMAVIHVRLSQFTGPRADA